MDWRWAACRSYIQASLKIWFSCPAQVWVRQYLMYPRNITWNSSRVYRLLLIHHKWCECLKCGLQTFNDSSFPFLQVQLAEMEALSLNSDKSSSILLGDESDNRSTSQLSPKETKVSPRWSWACCTLYFCACFSEVLSIHPSVPAEEYKCWSLFKRFSIEEKKKDVHFWKFSSLLSVTASERA